MKEKLQKLAHNNTFLIGTFIVALIVTGFVTYRLLMGEPVTYDNPVVTDDASASASFSDLEELDELDAFNVLLLGYGGAGHDGGFLNDVTMLVHFDFTNDILAFISIPRDLWVELPGGRQTKINAAFTPQDAAQYPLEEVSLSDALSGAVQTKSVIEDVTGLTPHFFMGIDFNSFIAAIDKLGGVDVDVPEAFGDPWYPVKGRELDPCGHSPEEITELSNTLSGFELEKQFACRYEQLSFDAGDTHLDGETALKFVRSRHGTGGGDFDRSRRQQALLVGVRDGLLSMEALSDPVGVFQTFSGMVRTNLNENLAKNIAKILSGVGQYRVVNINLSTQNVLTQGTAASGAFILQPTGGDWEGVQAYIQQELAKE